MHPAGYIMTYPLLWRGPSFMEMAKGAWGQQLGCAGVTGQPTCIEDAQMHRYARFEVPLRSCPF